MCALVRAARLRHRLPRRRSRPRAGRPAPGPGDRPRQRQPLQRVTPGGQSVPDSRPNTATRWPRSITSLWPSATTTTRATPPLIRSPLAVLAALFDRLGRYEPAATIAGFAFSPLTAAAVPEISTAIAHLREVLGDQTYESLARKGETMTTAAMATYALRPNRPGPSRTERRLEIDGLRILSRSDGREKHHRAAVIPISVVDTGSVHGRMTSGNQPGRTSGEGSAQRAALG